MSLSDITSRQPILDAIAEFNRLKPDQFLKKYGFRRSRSYWLVHDNQRYDSKAIVGAAHGYARPDLGPLKASEFSGGEASIRRKLEQLGFRVEVDDTTASTINLTSEQLTPEKIYTRAHLKSLFKITDGKLNNNGVFHPKETSSVWLFITENKTIDSTPYNDRLKGDILYCEGQMSGRTDELIIDHQAKGMELLVFFREKKNQYPAGGFRYLGPFVYLSHTVHRTETEKEPTSFVLQRRRNSTMITSSDTADDNVFDLTSLEDAREKILRSITQRRGQKPFRNALIAAYGGQCAITGCSILDVLEAAHIHPYLGPDTNKVTNGLLLRSDIHTLFDCGLVAIDSETMTVLVAPHLKDSEYGVLHGTHVHIPQNPAEQPSAEALEMHRKDSGL